MTEAQGGAPSDRTPTYDTVLVPTDGSNCARTGARHGVHIARAFDATVHAVHAFKTGAGLRSLGRSTLGRGGDRQRAAGERILSGVETLGDEFGVDVTTELLEGPPAETITDTVVDGGIDFVAMGTSGRSNLERHLLGSVTERVVRTSPIPVLTVRSADGPSIPADREYTDVLLPTRGGEGSELAVEHAVSIAARFDATLHAMYVVDVRSQAARDDTYDLEVLVDELKTEVTDAVMDRADAAGVDARAVIQQGTPHSAIQRYADRNDIDLMIMGTHGRGPVEQLLLGSITERTIRTADVPVITVRLDEWFGADGGSPTA